MGYNLLINGRFRGYTPFTNHLFTNFLGHPSIPDSLGKMRMAEEPVMCWKIGDVGE